MGFFDDITKKVSETTNSVTEKTNKIAKESKLKKSISENEGKVERIYRELGKTVLEKKDNMEEVSKAVLEYSEQIENIKKENEELKTEILLLNNKKRCCNCSAEIDAQVSFCPECGKEQEKTVEAVEKVEEEKIPEGKRKCVGCGEIIETKYTFCPLCGTQAETETAIEGEVVDNKEGNNE